MSQDQKPARVRIVDGSGGNPAAAAGGGGAAIAAAPAAPDAAPAAGKARGGLLPAALFLAGCIGGGVAVARLMP